MLVHSYRDCHCLIDYSLQVGIFFTSCPYSNQTYNDMSVESENSKYYYIMDSSFICCVGTYDKI